MYFATTGFVSTGGRRLAHFVAASAGEVLQTTPSSLGNRTPVLRETRMPAVQLRVGPAGLVGTHLATLAGALVAAIEHWFLEPIDDVHPEQ